MKKSIAIVTLYKGTLGAQRTSHALPLLERKTKTGTKRIGWFHVVGGGYRKTDVLMGEEASKDYHYNTQRGVERAWAKAVLSGYTIVKDAPLSGFPS